MMIDLSSYMVPFYSRKSASLYRKTKIIIIKLLFIRALLTLRDTILVSAIDLNHLTPSFKKKYNKILNVLPVYN